MMLLGCLSNSVLNRLVTSYSNEAMAGMGIAKKIDMIAFSVAQGMTQGVLPLVAYNYASSNRDRMRRSIRMTLTYTLAIACTATLTLFLFAGPITRCFIDNDTTVVYGRDFLRVICFTCPSTAVNFMVITVFQATKQKVKPLILSFLRKGSLDIPLMLVLNHLVGLQGTAWATPLADWIALLVSVLLFIPYLNRLGGLVVKGVGQPLLQAELVLVRPLLPEAEELEALHIEHHRRGEVRSLEKTAHLRVEVLGGDPQIGVFLQLLNQGPQAFQNGLAVLQNPLHI